MSPEDLAQDFATRRRDLRYAARYFCDRHKQVMIAAAVFHAEQTYSWILGGRDGHTGAARSEEIEALESWKSRLNAAATPTTRDIAQRFVDAWSRGIDLEVHGQAHPVEPSIVHKRKAVCRVCHTPTTFDVGGTRGVVRLPD